MSDDAQQPNERLDADAIYRQIGLFVVVFQSLEALLVEICWLTTEPPYAPDGRSGLVGLSLAGLVTETGRRVDAFLTRRGLDDSDFRRDFRTRFQELLAHCRTIAKHRNRTVHSAYVHLEGGGELRGILRSDMTAGSDGDDVDFDSELLTAKSFDDALQDMAWTGFHLSQSKVQLIHWTP